MGVVAMKHLCPFALYSELSGVFTAPYLDSQSRGIRPTRSQGHGMYGECGCVVVGEKKSLICS